MPPGEAVNGKSYSPRNEPAREGSQDVARALDVIDRHMRNARVVRALRKAVARLECEITEKLALIDEIERSFLYEQAWTLDEISAARAQIESFEILIHKLEGAAS